MELLVTMHQGTPYGHLSLEGTPLGDDEVARMVGIATREYRRLLSELERHRVFSRTNTGVIYSRRMVRDEQVRNARAAGGVKGAPYGVKGAESGRLGGRPSSKKRAQETPLTPPLLTRGELPTDPPPSSSSSSSNPLIAADAAMTPPAAANRDQAETDSAAWARTRQELLERFESPAHRSAAEGYLRSAQFPENVARRLLFAMNPEGDGYPPAVVGQALDDMRVNSVTRFHVGTFTGYVKRILQARAPGDSVSGEAGDDLEQRILNDIRIGRYA